MPRLWKYLENQFLNETENNFLKALILAEYTNAALLSRNANPFFNTQYVFFNPLYVALDAAFDKWDTQKGTQKGKTLSVKDTLKQLSPPKINQWDAAVQAALIPKGSANYVAIFPNGHKPFQTGNIITRVNAVNSLSQAIALQIPPLAPPTHPLVLLKADVDAFYNIVNVIRTSQQSEKSDTGTDSIEVDAARVAAMKGLYAVLGACMNQFSDNPVVIEPLFDLETLRDIEQTLWHQTIAAATLRFIFKRTVEAAQQIRIKVNSTKPLTFAFVNEKNDAIGVLSVTVQGEEEEIVTASQLGNVPADTFFKVQNTDGAVEGDFIVEIL